MPYANPNDPRGSWKSVLARRPVIVCPVCAKETHNRKYCSRKCASLINLNTPERKEIARQGAKKLRKAFCKNGHDYLVSRRVTKDKHGHDHPFCFECHAARKTSYRLREPERYEYAMRKHNYNRKGGLTPEDYEYLCVVQDGKCAICGADRSNSFRKRLALDHDHILGTNRGLLCSSCNQGLGHYRDNPALLRKAAEYIEAWAQARAEQKAA